MPNGLRYLLYGLGLVVVAVAAGLVWWLIRSPSDAGGDFGSLEPSRQNPLTSGEFTYTAVVQPTSSDDCAANSYGKVSDWFVDNPCKALVRGMYTTEVQGERALVSVVRVTMPSAEAAARLKVVTDTNGTGNVNDLQRDDTVNLPGAPSVASGEYASTIDAADLTIVETAFFDDHSDAGLLKRIAKDALRLSEALDSS